MVPTVRSLTRLADVPDRTLTERALHGSSPALTELYQRHARTAALFAAVVSGRPSDVPDTITEAFTTALTTLADNRTEAAGEFLPTLLRCTRMVTIAGAHDKGADAYQLAHAVPGATDSASLTEAFSRLSEPERSALWLREVAGFDAAATDVALGFSGSTAVASWATCGSAGDALLSGAVETLGDHRKKAVAALAGINIILNPSSADEVVREWKRARTARFADRWPRLRIVGTPAIELALGRTFQVVVVAVLAAGALGFAVTRSGDANSLDDRIQASQGKPGDRQGVQPAAARRSTDRPGRSLQGRGQGVDTGAARSTPEVGSSPAGTVSRSRVTTVPSGPAGRRSPASPSQPGGGSARFLTVLNGLGLFSGSPPAPTTTAPKRDKPTSRPKKRPPARKPPTSTTRPPRPTPTTRPPATSPPTTAPSTTSPPTTEPPTTSPPTTEPPTTSPPTTEPPTTSPPTTEPPTTEPPTTAPPPTDPPTITSPPITDPPTP